MGSSKKHSRSEPVVVTPAKITRPVLADVYARTRLFRELDTALKKPIVWLCAPGGAGKTTVVASYLEARQLPSLWYQVDRSDEDIASFFYYLGLAAKALAPRSTLPLLAREYLSGLSAFTANYFRELFSHFRRRSVLVIDNCQDATAGGKLPEVLAEGFDQIPDDVNVIVISREPPPAALANAAVRGRISMMNWDMLKLTEEESCAIADLRNRNETLAPDTLHRLHAITQGWVAGVVLLTERAQRSFVERQPVESITSQVVFDYFATEILEHQDTKVQMLLLRTAFVREISATTACALVGDANAGATLATLTRRNLFTFRHANGNFEYHPLFRAFLVNRVNALYSADEVRELKRNSANALMQSGEVEAAISLLLDAKDWGDALTVVLQQAHALRMQGRTQTLEGWLVSIPESVRIDNPWALYWLGICRLSFAPTQARMYLERAFALFEKQNDSAPLYLTWCKIIDSIIYEWEDFTAIDKWIDRYSALKENRVPPPARVENASIFAYLTALTHSRTHHVDLDEYLARAEKIFETETNEDRRLAQANVLMGHYIWKGNAGQMTKMLALFTAHAGTGKDTLRRLLSYTWTAYGAGILCSSEESFRAATEGLALAKATGVHLFDSYLLNNGVVGQLYVGNTRAAREMLNQRSLLPLGSRFTKATYSHTMSMLALHEGNFILALDEARRAVELANAGSFGCESIAVSLALAYMQVRLGNIAEAAALIAEVRPIASAIRTARFLYHCALCDAHIHYLQRDRAATLRSLEEALAIAREGGFLTPAYCPRDTASVLYAIALDAGIQVEYIRTIIRKTQLSPPEGNLTELWPWSVKIYTLGPFSVMKSDCTLSFDGKAQKKPLELLRSLIAFGGREVSAAKITQALWPETEGDVARINLRSTVFRLRRLIGEEAIIFNEGDLTLDPDHCWIDVWALEQLCDEPLAGLSLVERAERLLRLYRGAFLTDDDESAWVLVYRERLRSKFLRALLDICTDLEKRGDAIAAIPLYGKCIEVDPMAEELYRRLMRCYQKLDEPAQALAIYQRCHATLTSVFHIEPSMETQRLYSEIQARGN